MESISTFKANDGKEIELFISKPKEFNSAIIVVHEGGGLTEYIKNVSRRLSNESFLAVAPNLYSRNKEIFNQNSILSVMKKFWSLSPYARRNKKAIEKLYNSLDDKEKLIFQELVINREKTEERMLEDLGSLYKKIKEDFKPKRIGIIGFCMGGGLAFQFSTIEKFNATVVYYGRNPKPIENIKNIKGAVLAIYAGNDQSINKELPELMKVIIENQIDFEMKLYPNTYHAFATEGGMNYNEEAAKDAWQRTLFFFKKHLL